MGGGARQSALRCRANGCKQGAKGDGEYGEREEEAGRGRGGGGGTSLPAAPFRPTPEALSLPPGGGTSLPPDAGGALAGAGAWAGGGEGACMDRGERGGIRIGADSDGRSARSDPSIRISKCIKSNFHDTKSHFHDMRSLAIENLSACDIRNGAHGTQIGSMNWT